MTALPGDRRVVDARRAVEAMAALPYGGEAVDQRTHALLGARAALAAGADEELVVATLLHDVGRVPSVARAHPGVPHEAAGATWCAPRFGARVAWLVGAHVQAKRVLVVLDAGYAQRLSPASVRSLAAQGGPAGPGAVEAFLRHPWAGDALRLRRWDDDAKDPEAAPAPAEDVFAAVASVAGAPRR